MHSWVPGRGAKPVPAQRTLDTLNAARAGWAAGRITPTAPEAGSMVRRTPRRMVAGALLAAPLAARDSPAMEQAMEPARTTIWSPTRTVRFVIAFPPGGSSDIAARWLARKLA